MEKNRNTHLDIWTGKSEYFCRKYLKTKKTSCSEIRKAFYVVSLPWRTSFGNKSLQFLWILSNKDFFLPHVPSVCVSSCLWLASHFFLYYETQAKSGQHPRCFDHSDKGKVNVRMCTLLQNFLSEFMHWISLHPSLTKLFRWP